MKQLYVLIFLCLCLGLFYRYGRSIYMPFIHKINGKETVESINKNLSKKVFANLKTILDKNGFSNFPKKILIVGIKEEEKLEIYGDWDNQWRFLKSYNFTANSGSIGPKLLEGDRQIPEGIYSIEYLNPNSNYYLSLKVSYPNDFDKKKAIQEDRKKLGGDIFIHGNNVTIGCIPIGDEAIEEVFILAANALQNPIKVILSPRDFRKNKTLHEVETVNWEKELYENIKQELQQVPPK